MQLCTIRKAHLPSASERLRLSTKKNAAICARRDLRASSESVSEGNEGETSRRFVLCGLPALTALIALPQTATGFENGLKYDGPKYPKRKGQMPADLGVRPDGGLKGCDFVKPNCFSTSKLEEEDLFEEPSAGPHTLYLIPPFTYTKSQSAALADLVSVLEKYEPGQSGIDGGGFKIITQQKDYVYVQFQSLKYGYIDDAEFVLNDGSVNMRSASRLGYLDFGVNAKRLNYIAKKLGAVEGWTTSQITPSTHPNYFELNKR